MDLTHPQRSTGEKHHECLGDYGSLIDAAPADRQGWIAVEAGRIARGRCMWRASRTAMHQPASIKTAAALDIYDRVLRERLDPVR